MHTDLQNLQNFIIDSRYRLQLIAFILLYDSKFGSRQKNYINYIKKSNWWVRSNVVYQAQKNGSLNKLGPSFIEEYIKSQECELATSGAYCYLLAPMPNNLPPVNTLSPYAQNIFKQAGVIKRNRYSNSQIQRYLKELANIQQKLQWKKKLGIVHDQFVRTLFTAIV